ANVIFTQGYKLFEQKRLTGRGFSPLECSATIHPDGRFLAQSYVWRRCDENAALHSYNFRTCRHSADRNVLSPSISVLRCRLLPLLGPASRLLAWRLGAWWLGASRLGTPRPLVSFRKSFGDPGVIRTRDLRFRKPLLYPAELRGQAR